MKSLVVVAIVLLAPIFFGSKAGAQAIVITPSTSPVVFQGTTLQFSATGGAGTWSCVGCLGSINSVTGLYTAPAVVTPQQSFGGYQLLPNNHIYNTRIDSLPVNSSSTYLINGAGTVPLSYESSFPSNFVAPTTPTKAQKFNFTPGNNGVFQIPTYPLATQENGWFTPFSDGDHHLITIDTTTGVFQEIYQPVNGYQGSLSACPSCSADSGIRYQNSTYNLPNTQGGSTDAAGLYLMPLTLHPQELEYALQNSTTINHALRFTLQNGFICGSSVAGICAQNATGSRHLWPATADTTAGAGVVPYGARFRLKSIFNISTFSPIAQILLTQLKQYGIILADGGTGWAVGGQSPSKLPPSFSDAFFEIGSANIKPSNFEAVDESSLMISPTSGDTTQNRETVTFTRTAGGTGSVDVTLIGVSVSLPTDTLYIQAGVPAQQLKAYVNGGANNTVNWSMIGSTGTLTSGGLYTPPATATAILTTTVTATSTDNTNVSAQMTLAIYPNGTMRIIPSVTNNGNTFPSPPYTDTSGNVWSYGLGGDGTYGYPSFMPTTIPNYQIYQTPIIGGIAADLRFDIVVPTGAYQLTGKFVSVASGVGQEVFSIETNGVISRSNLDIYAAAGASNKPVDEVSTSVVTNGSLSYGTLSYVLRPGPSTGSEFNGQAHISALQIIPILTPVITSTVSTTGVLGIAFSYQITATGSPTSYSATGLPGGLSINTTNGIISGTPTVAGTFTVALGATNAYGPGAATLTLTIFAAPPTPGTPGQPTGAAVGVSSISWNWSAAQFATSYKTLRAASGAVLASTPTLAYFDTGLATNTAYGLLVEGVDVTVLGPLSAPTTVYTLAVPPAGSVVNPVAATSATLSWSLNTNPPLTMAEVQRSVDGVTFVSLGSTYTATSFVDYSLLACSTYYYRVRNLNGDGLPTSFDSVAGPFVTSSTIPSPASALTATALGGNRISLAWTPSPTVGIAGYDLFYDAGTGTVNYGSPLASLGGSATSYLTSVLTSSGSYIFALRAKQCGIEETTGVFAAAAATTTISALRADISYPASGSHVYGNDLTVVAALTAGTPAQVRQISFQYRTPSGSGPWTNMVAADVNHENPAAAEPFFIHWNVGALATGSYDLRAVAEDVNDSTDTTPDVVTVVVAPAAATATIVENFGSAVTTTFNTDVLNAFFAGGTNIGDPLINISIPPNAVNGSTVGATISVVPPSAIATPPAGFAVIGNLVMRVTLSNGQSFFNPGDTARIAFGYPGVLGLNPQIWALNENTGVWSQTGLATTVDPVNHLITTNSPHFTVFAVLTGGAPAADLSSVRVYPIPYKPNGRDPNQGGGGTGIFFDQLPTSASIKIYTATGQLVTSFDASSPTGKVIWDGRNGSGRDTATGFYMAVISSPGRSSITKKILIVR